MIEVLYWLDSVEGIGPLKIKRIVQEVGVLSVLWDATYDELRGYDSIAPKLARAMINRRNKLRIQNEIQEIVNLGVILIGFLDETYPAQLKQIHDPPPILYAVGNTDILLQHEDYLIGIVGTRKPTPYGQKVTESVTTELTNSNMIIVSGMAKGIDAIAHKTTFDNKSKTIAVLGCGCDVIYPKSNAYIYEGILKNKGLILSEFPPGTQPLKHHFPRRNRIISGLSRSLLVVEAGERSGSLITAKYAVEQGRVVMCVPGNVTNPMSKGSLKLIREGAIPIGCGKDILDELNIKFQSYELNEKLVTTTLEKSLAMIEPATADQISTLLDTDVYDIMLQLTLLEVRGRVKRLAGGLYICS